MDSRILQLLAGTNPRQAQDFILSFGEQRTATWADAHRQASARSASEKHVPHYRGQLRHQWGEASLAAAASVAKAGCIPIRTLKPGGVFMVARIGHFGLLNLTLQTRRALPRRSITRRFLSQPNEDLDPQRSLLFSGAKSSRGVTELAYLGFMVATPTYRDPLNPHEIVFAVPNDRLTAWIEWKPLHEVYALLEDLASKDAGKGTPYARPIPDRRFPTIKLPKQDKGSDGGGLSG